MTDRITGRDIILGIIENMQAGAEPLLRTSIVPSLFDVYLHADDYERIVGILPLLTAEAQTGLDEAIAERNRTASAKPWQWLARLPFGARHLAPTKWLKPLTGWSITFHQNVDEDVKPGGLLIESTLALPDKPELGAGMGTKRIRTLRSGGVSRVVATVGDTYASVPQVAPPAARLPINAVARFAWRDQHGAQSYLMTTNQIVAGRGGDDHWVDLKLEAAPDISREHFRLRRDEKTGEFFIRDLSTYGTSVNGQRLPSSLAASGDEKRDIHREVLLPQQARLELAGVLVIEFMALEVIAR